MKLSKLRKHHSWLGLIIGLPLVFLCLSGIVLNHRSAISSVDVSRGSLPEEYSFQNWNNGLMRGTCVLDSSHLLIYGKAGVFKFDKQSREISDLNAGFPEGVDNRSVNRILRAGDGNVYAVAQYGLYRLDNQQWVHVQSVNSAGERLVDMTLANDSSLAVLGRSHIYRYSFSGEDVQLITLPNAVGEKPHVSLFRVVWTLHSGELFGMAGKIFVDLMALIFIFLFVSGVVIWLLPRLIRYGIHKCSPVQRKVQCLRWNVLWHDKLGRYTIMFTLFVAFTGWLLRPPMLVAIMGHDISFDSTENAWEDKLRALQYDDDGGDFLLATSDGFYILDSLLAQPRLSDSQPPVSVMGINVLEKNAGDNQWLVGSFSGLYLWNRADGSCIDAITGASAGDNDSMIPIGNVKVSGFSSHFEKPLVCSYDSGILGEEEKQLLPQPDWMNDLPMSLWNLALEVHTGRIFTFMGIFSTLLYIFVIGLSVMYILYTGWRIRKR